MDQLRYTEKVKTGLKKSPINNNSVLLMQAVKGFAGQIKFKKRDTSVTTKLH